MGAARSGTLRLFALLLHLQLQAPGRFAAAAAWDNSSGWFPSPVEGVKGQSADAAQPGVAYSAQPFDPDRICTVNSFDPRQVALDEVRELTRAIHTLGNATLTVASWEPRIVVVDDFMSHAEADHLIAQIGDPHRTMGGTAVVTTNGGAAVLENTVTSKIGTVPMDDPVVQAINERIAELSFIPTDWAEPFHALHYDAGQYFRGHLDVHAKKGRPTSTRVATVLCYLSDVEAGGETYFPLAKRADGGRDPPPDTCAGYVGKDTDPNSPTAQPPEAAEQYYDGSEFAAGRFSAEEMATLGVQVIPKKGRVVLWWNRKKDGSVDWRSRHCGCPLIAGEKWAATKWIHYKTPSDDLAMPDFAYRSSKLQTRKLSREVRKLSRGGGKKRGRNSGGGGGGGGGAYSVNDKEL